METKQLTVATYTFGEGVGQAQHEEQFETVAALLDKLYDPLEKSDAYGDYMMLQMMMVETDGGKTLRHARYCDEAMDIEHTLYEWDGECYHSVTFVYTNPEIPLVRRKRRLLRRRRKCRSHRWCSRKRPLSQSSLRRNTRSEARYTLAAMSMMTTCQMARIPFLGR